MSAQRAVGLVLLVALGRSRGRAIQPLALLGLVAVAVLCVDPSAIGTPGFQLSFGALIGLIRVTPVLTGRLPEDLPRPLSWLAGSMATTVAATVGTLPAAAWWFQELAVLAVPANLFAIPWMALTVVPCAILSAFGPAGIDSAAAQVGSAAVEVLLAVLGPLDVAPLTPATGPLGSLLLLALPLCPRRPGIWVWSLLFALGLQARPTVPTVTFLDVGQGDAALVEQPDGRRWLIDSGPSGRPIVAWLRRRGIRHLDVVVASHGQADHVGGLVEILDAVSVGEVQISDRTGLDAVIAAADRQGVPVVQGPPGRLHPQPDFQGDDLNDRSLSLLAAQVLFTGDVEWEGEQALSRQSVSATVLKVPHHGSRTSSSTLLLDAVRPDIAVISVGRDNRYRHPSPIVVARYLRRGIELFRTDRDGTIEVQLCPGGPRVRTHRPGRGWRLRSGYGTICASQTTSM